MKPRARRVTIAAAVLGAGVVAVFVVLNWGTMRDHVEAWRFQLTRETVTIEPDLARRGRLVDLQAQSLGVVGQSAEGWGPVYRTFAFLDLVANYSGCPVIFAPEDRMALDTPITLVSRYKNVAADIARALLQANGWRILEQRFPRRAYVVIREQGATR
jgi:hypothetical protein